VRSPFSFAMIATLAGMSLADSQGSAAENKIVVVEAYYEYQVGPPIVGIIVNRHGTLVDFQPCTGDLVPGIEESLLKATDRNCGTEPPGRSIPVGCMPSDVPDGAKTVMAAAGYATGTTFEFEEAGIGMSTPPPGGQWTAWSQVSTAGIVPCGKGDVIVIPLSTSDSWFGIVKDKLAPKGPVDQDGEK
jgi:hypothetical protein